MPDKETLERAHEDYREGKSPSTQAGEFVREEIDHIREGKHGAASTKQAIAIGLSKALAAAGVKLPPPDKGKVSAKARAQAERDFSEGSKPHPPSAICQNVLAPPAGLLKKKAGVQRLINRCRSKLVPLHDSVVLLHATGQL